MCPAPQESPRATVDTVHGTVPDTAPEQQVEQTLAWCEGIVMGVHRCGPDAAATMVRSVAGAHALGMLDLATATVELVRGAPPSDPAATVVAMRFLMGRAAYSRPVLDGQVHASVRDAAADMHPGPDAEVEALLVAADGRDRAAEARDHAAADRDAAAGQRHEEASGDPRRDDAAREQAALDRAWAATDRDLSAGDRAALVDRLRDSSQPERPESAGP